MKLRNPNHTVETAINYKMSDAMKKTLKLRAEKTNRTMSRYLTDLVILDSREDLLDCHESN